MNVRYFELSGIGGSGKGQKGGVAVNHTANELMERVRQRESQPEGQPDYQPGDDPGEFGRRVARWVFENYVVNQEPEVQNP